MNITTIEANLYEIPLPEVLTDSTHGEMRHLSVVTVIIRCDNGEEGLGYTYTVGKTGVAAILTMIERDLIPVLVGSDPRRIEYLWEKMWWQISSEKSRVKWGVV